MFSSDEKSEQKVKRLQYNYSETSGNESFNIVGNLFPELQEYFCCNCFPWKSS